MPLPGIVLVDIPMNVQVTVGRVTIVGDTPRISSFGQESIAATDLVLDPAMARGDILACKDLALAREEADYGPGDCHDCYREGFYYLRCGDVSGGGGVLLCVAVIAVIVLVVGGTPFVVRFIRKRTRRGEPYQALGKAEDGENNELQDLPPVAPQPRQQRAHEYLPRRAKENAVSEKTSQH
ncbi:hypothetical protein AAVH_19709 [Aphelenchoides avenae]|nr:hypothetical protein AAVH_19709 [Aphelenchus avenae]